MSNYTILQKNTLDGLSETAGCLYMTLLDVFEGHTNRAGERKAFFAACHYEGGCGKVLGYILRNNPVHDLDESTMSELNAFFAKRWQHNFMESAA